MCGRIPGGSYHHGEVCPDSSVHFLRWSFGIFRCESHGPPRFGCIRPLRHAAFVHPQCRNRACSAHACWCRYSRPENSGWEAHPRATLALDEAWPRSSREHTTIYTGVLSAQSVDLPSGVIRSTWAVLIHTSHVEVVVTEPSHASLAQAVLGS